jgi:hypothetical protein
VALDPAAELLPVIEGKCSGWLYKICKQKNPEMRSLLVEISLELLGQRLTISGLNSSGFRALGIALHAP